MNILRFYLGADELSRIALNFGNLHFEFVLNLDIRISNLMKLASAKFLMDLYYG